jgi:hypothetical protein
MARATVREHWRLRSPYARRPPRGRGGDRSPGTGEPTVGISRIQGELLKLDCHCSHGQRAQRASAPPAPARSTPRSAIVAVEADGEVGVAIAEQVAGPGLAVLGGARPAARPAGPPRRWRVRRCSRRDGRSGCRPPGRRGREGAGADRLHGDEVHRQPRSSAARAWR